ncbi:MAG TPA: histidine kinase dimerization/phospho-acceptor domain-containing protein, partial [Ktedonobacteraceae bacterium]|nr:histidine kinase dimerization/phospho-acceptor domain-containing protein [Ktedonobacteraceae bacterium]
MGNRSHYVLPHKPKHGGMPGGKSIPRARSMGRAHKRFNQVEAIWEASPDGLIACNRNQSIVRINPAARTLFEVGSETQYQGRDFRQFLTPYIRADEQPPFVSGEPWLTNLARAYETGASSPAQPLLLHLPSGRKAPVTVHSFPVGEHGRHPEKTILVFHGWPEISHLQWVQEAMVDLLNAIAQIPEQVDRVLPEETFLLSPPVLFVAQQVVDVIRSVLKCLHVNMVAFGCRTSYLYFVAGSGWTAKQEQYWRDIGGFFHPSEVLGDAAFARLGTNQEVVRAMDQLHTIERFGKQLPFPADLYPVSPGSETILHIPLFLEQKWAGVLGIIKATAEGEYTPEEIALAKAVTAQTMLVIEGIHCLYAQEEQQNRALIQREVRRLAGDFLTLATHELRTPLTGIMGNLQLAERRLIALKDQFTPLSAQIREPLAQVQHPLVSASQSAQVQQRMINDLIDDARIQTKTLLLSLHQEDLGTLLREVVVRQ